MSLSPLLILLFGAALAAAAQLPGGIKQCSVKNVNECVMAQASDVIKRIVKGDRKMKIPVLDPLKIESIHIQQGRNKNNFVNITFTDMNLNGLKDAQLMKSEIDFDKKIIKWSFLVKPLIMVSDYVMDGKFLLVPLTGRGKSTITIEQGTFVYTVNFTIQKKSGEDYLVLGKPSLTFDITKVLFNFENLFNGDKTLGKSVNDVLNENWDVIVKDVGPALRDAILSVLHNILTNLSIQFPFKDIVKPT